MTRNTAKNIFIGGTVVTAAIFLALTIKSYASYPERTKPENISPAVVLGKEVWEKNACVDCHTLLGEGAYYAPELGNVIARRGEDGVRSILKAASESGWGTTRKMPRIKMTDEEINGLVEFFKWNGNINTSKWPPNVQG